MGQGPTSVWAPLAFSPRWVLKAICPQSPDPATRTYSFSFLPLRSCNPGKFCLMANLHPPACGLCSLLSLLGSQGR